MQGYPKNIATKADIEYLMSYLGTASASDENKKRGISYLNALLNTKHYVFDRTLTADEAPDGSAPDYKVIDSQGDEQNERHQFLLQENDEAQLYKMELTKTEVQNWITEIEGGAQ